MIDANQEVAAEVGLVDCGDIAFARHLVYLTEETESDVPVVGRDQSAGNRIRAKLVD
jgi:hypothetical protein